MKSVFLRPNIGWILDRLGVLVLGVLIATVCVASEPPRARPDAVTSQQPNVVMIIIDTLRADKLSSYGNPEPTTPEIDAIAKAGVRFERVLAQSSWTKPSIASMLTSRYPRSLGMYRERSQILADRFLTLAEILKSHGYATVGITANPNINAHFNFQQGFDHYIDSAIRWKWMPDDGKPTPNEKRLTPATELFDAVLNLVETDPKAPYYVQINIMEMHAYHKGDRSLTRDEFKTLFGDAANREYLQALRQVSMDINDFVTRWLAVSGRSDTLFLLVSDHGEGLEDHPAVELSDGHGFLLYESNLRVPLILYHPGSALKPRTVAQDVRLLDLLPTVLDYLGLPKPEELDGVSLLPLVAGTAAVVPLPEHFVAETQYRGREKIAVYSAEWKFIQNRRPHRGVNRSELQAVDVTENGRLTDQIHRQRAAVDALKRSLAAWEGRYPKQPPTRAELPMPPEVREQLKSLGYID